MRFPRPFPIALVLCALPLAAQTPPTATGQHFEFGLEERVRSEDWDNIVDHDNAKADYRTQYRFRTRAWATYTDGSDLEISAGLVNENRRISSPAAGRFNGREVFFETLYLDYKFSKDLSVRIGRQNIMRGEGFIFMDGTAGDGSRSAYFNAVDLAYSWSKSKLEFLAISNPLKDKYLPVLNEITNPKEMNRLQEWDEQALGFYYTGKEWTGNQLEAYALYKTEKGDYREPAATAQPERKFTTLGARIVQDLAPGWTATGEYALQRGTQEAAISAPAGTPTKDIAAWGGYVRLKKAFEASWKPTASVAYIALSGQDPNDTTKVTAWNPVFSRWPKWSELYVYSQGPEKGVGYWTNTGMWELEARCSPTKNFDLRATYYRMSALQPLVAKAGPVFATGKTRGDLWQVRGDYRFTPAFKGHVVYEHLAPGDAYVGSSGGHYLRFEAAYLFKKRL